MSNRPPMPKFLEDYYAVTKAGVPNCCHSCDYYSAEGMCRKFQSEPPAEFIQTRDSCDLYVEAIPF